MEQGTGERAPAAAAPPGGHWVRKSERCKEGHENLIKRGFSGKITEANACYV